VSHYIFTLGLRRALSRPFTLFHSLSDDYRSNEKGASFPSSATSSFSLVFYLRLVWLEMGLASIYSWCAPSSSLFRALCPALMAVFFFSPSPFLLTFGFFLLYLGCGEVLLGTRQSSPFVLLVAPELILNHHLLLLFCISSFLFRRQSSPPLFDSAVFRIVPYLLCEFFVSLSRLPFFCTLPPGEIKLLHVGGPEQPLRQILELPRNQFWMHLTPPLPDGVPPSCLLSLSPPFRHFSSPPSQTKHTSPLPPYLDIFQTIAVIMRRAKFSFLTYWVFSIPGNPWSLSLFLEYPRYCFSV